jgi:hypothetical protein
MAVKKPATKKTSPAARMQALALSLGNLSDLLGGSTVTLGGQFTPNTLIAYMGDPGPSNALKKDGIHVTLPRWGTRVYTLVGGNLLLTRDEGTPNRPNVVSSFVNWEEPVAFLLEHHSDIFKDATQYCDYEDVKV